jgi:photosystem II stability/assembly factor-like uncharacterized protein
VTSGEVRLINSSGNGLLASWKPATATHNASPGGSITLAAASPCQVLLSGGGGRLWLLECTQDGQLVEVAGAVMEAEVACLDVTPVGEETTAIACTSAAWLSFVPFRHHHNHHCSLQGA